MIPIAWCLILNNTAWKSNKMLLPKVGYNKSINCWGRERGREGVGRERKKGRNRVEGEGSVGERGFSLNSK